MCCKLTNKAARGFTNQHVEILSNAVTNRSTLTLAFTCRLCFTVWVLKVQAARCYADRAKHANAHDQRSCSRSCSRQDVVTVESRRRQRRFGFWRTGGVTPPPRQHAKRCCFIKSIGNDSERDTTIGSHDCEIAAHTQRIPCEEELCQCGLSAVLHLSLSTTTTWNLPADVTSEAGQVTEGRGGIEKEKDKDMITNRLDVLSHFSCELWDQGKALLKCVALYRQ